MGFFSEAEEVARDLAGQAARLAEGMIRRAVISRINDAKALAVAQLRLLDNEPEPAEVFQQYGFTSNPPVDSEAIVIRVGGVAEHQIAIATAKRDTRPKVSAGEVKIYVEDGPLIHITSSEIRLGSGATKEVARKGDAIQSDSAFDTWALAVEAGIAAAGGGTVGPLGVKAVD
jgi:phage baseplate assembly protein V